MMQKNKNNGFAKPLASETEEFRPRHAGQVAFLEMVNKKFPWVNEQIQ